MSRHLMARFRRAMPTYYHYTEDPDFEPDPNEFPLKADEGTPGGPGIFVAPEDQDWWSDYGPYRAEFHSPHDLANHPDVWTPRTPDGERYPMEMFVPGHLFDQWEYRGLSEP
jgi:hypothetical protein